MKPVVLMLAAGLAAASTAAQAADVTVDLTGVSAQGGQMLVSLQTRDQFMKPAGASGAFGEATAGRMTLVVRDVAPGDYAVMVMHDADSNWAMARGAGGMPAEGWAMSGAAPADRAPTFDEVKITVPEGGKAVSLPLTYPK